MIANINPVFSKMTVLLNTEEFLLKPYIIASLGNDPD
jgi:hypothetical protein